MFSREIFTLVICFILTFTAAIRVHWNTNTGPIVPPTPRTTVRPQLPYREPAPVWEDQANDIPNPNPYVYILPPPSRPRTANNYLTSDRRPPTQWTYNNQYGKILPGSDAKTNGQNGVTTIVASLSPKYVPNEGFKYSAVVPATKSNGYYFGTGNKFQGKYNAKTKKYKVYEKIKYQPFNYYPFFDFARPNEEEYLPNFDQAHFVRTQQLPMERKSQPFNVSVPENWKVQSHSNLQVTERAQTELSEQSSGKVRTA